MWNTSAPAGKIPYIPTWRMNCKISPVITAGNSVLPGSQLLNFGKELKNFDEFKITAAYDQQTLYSGSFTDTETIVIDQQLLDDKENTDHVFSIELCGKTDDHSCFYHDTSVSLAIQIDLSIEDMPLNLTLQTSGIKTIMGENEIQTFNIKTPIYRWLLQNQECIMADLFSIYKE
jgi:hypothetical protein